MQFLKPAFGFFLPLVAVLLIVRFSWMSLPEHPANLERDWIEEAYIPFDSLRTDVDAYCWPTDATTIISSAFAEFRRTHFHAGIDISTRGQQGYRVFASREGFVRSLSVSTTGYGLFLDVQHPDGFTTRYAHLQRFNDTLNAVIRLKQQDAGRYDIELTLDSTDFPVRAGDVIAYSGGTGIGAPHLHFELRDPDGNPINPLRLGAFRQAVQDAQRPVIRSVAFEPMDSRSTVNGSHRVVIIAAVRAKDSEFRLSRPVSLSGRVGVSVSTSDPFDGTWHKSSPHRLQLSIDDSVVYRSRLDHFNASFTKQIALHYNWSLLGRGRYQNLYVRTGNRMPMYERLREASGIVSHETVPAGRHQLRIDASDFHGNESSLLAELVVQSPNSARAEIAQRSPAAEIPEELQGSASGPPLVSVEPSEQSPDPKRGESAPPPHVVWAPELTRQTGDLTIEKEFHRTYALITLRTSGSYNLRPSLWVSAGGSRQLLDIDALDSRRYVGAFALDQIRSDRVRIEAYAEVDGSPVEALNEFTVAAVQPGRTTVVRSPDGRFSATFGENAVYEPLYVRMEERETGYALEPRSVLLDGGVDISLSVADADPDKKLGLYFGEEWDMDFTGRREATSPTTFRTRLTRMLGTVSVHRDSAPPTVAQLRIRPSRRSVRIDFRLWDDLSGVSSDGIHVMVDGERLIPVYDPYSRSVSAEGAVAATGADHTLELRVEDRNANATVIARRFAVRGR